MSKPPDTAFGRLMREGMHAKKLSQGRLGGRISDFVDGPTFDAGGVRMLMVGQRRLTHSLVAKIIEELELDWAEAWVASGLMPPEVTAEELRKIDPRRRRHNPGLRMIGLPEAREG